MVVVIHHLRGRGPASCVVDKEDGLCRNVQHRVKWTSQNHIDQFNKFQGIYEHSFKQAVPANADECAQVQFWADRGVGYWGARSYYYYGCATGMPRGDYWLWTNFPNEAVPVADTTAWDGFWRHNLTVRLGKPSLLEPHKVYKINWDVENGDRAKSPYEFGPEYEGRQSAEQRCWNPWDPECKDWKPIIPQYRDQAISDLELVQKLPLQMTRNCFIWRLDDSGHRPNEDALPEPGCP